MKEFEIETTIYTTYSVIYIGKDCPTGIVTDMSISYAGIFCCA
ncbi:hypothetical protein [Albibacterium sp.]|nr:hypothetical protein [Albibacterium sp.]HUH18116.1 hypothetical protein [Albibacterium sp.]